MQWDNLKENKGLWDDQLPEKNHQERFEQKLNEHFPTSSKTSLNWLKIAASLIVVITATWFLMKPNVSDSVAETNTNSSLPIEDAEYYYKVTIDKQFEMLAAYNDSPEFNSMIEDSKELIMKLEADYKELQKELERTADYRVAAAMISNYKSRIKILEELIQNIQYVNHLKQENHENLSI